MMRYIYTLLGLFMLMQAQATVRRVKATESTTGNGSSWSVAYPASSLQSVINMSSAGDEVWLSQGTFQLGSGVAYSMKSGVKIYGGYAALNATDVTRDARVYPTILRGNGFVVFNNNSVDGQAVLDGVTVRDGSNTTLGYQGGGMYNHYSSPQISNVSFIHNVCDGGGGGMCNTNSSPTLTNIVFDNNITGRGEGGAIYNDYGSPTLTNVVFYNNYAPSGGAISNNDGSNMSLYNCVFYKNYTYANGFGGGIENNGSTINVFNSTFVGNYCTKDGAGGGIHTYAPSGQTSAAFISNCVFWNNYDTLTGSAVRRVDIATSNTSATVNYSYFRETAAFSGTGNVTTTSTSPFKDVNNPIGADLAWMTTDDGLQPSLCTGTAIIDKGSNSYVPGTLIKDFANQTRIVLVPLITTQGTTAPVDMGAYENQTAVTITQLAGTIGNAHVIPYPQELTPDYVTNTQSPASTTGINWEQQIFPSTTWTTASPASSSLQYTIPALTQTTSYRRVITSSSYCNTPYYSNVIQIKVANPGLAQAGKIEGQVTSPNGSTGVKGVQVRVVRLAAISGSPVGFTYLDTTNDAGKFSISPIYYGDLDATGSSASFSVKAVKANHQISTSANSADSAIVTLSYYSPKAGDINFKDYTVLTINGSVFQKCTPCLLTNGTNGTQTCPIDSINIFQDGNYKTFTQVLNDTFGKYGITVIDPVQVKIEPRFTGHSFDTAFKLVTPFNNLWGVNFTDTTTHKISGSLRAGCNEIIGSATLEFYDTLPPNASGRVRPQGCFRKQVTTDVNGNYSITLPARPYKVKIIAFTPLSGAAYPVTLDSLKSFINNILPADSLYRDITTHDTTLKLVYVRPPVIIITKGLNVINCPSIPGGLSIVKQMEVEEIRVKVFQGVPANVNTGCTIADTTKKVTLFTNITSQSLNNDSVKFNPRDTGVLVRLKGGSPKITGDNFKTLAIYYTDKYGRFATPLSRTNILVTGAFQYPGANFLTVSPPPVPLLVLHDPPGDGSFSYWNSTKSSRTAFRMYAANAKETGDWLEVKLGTKIETGIGISTEDEVWATANGSVTQGKTNTSTTEQVYTNTYNSTLRTSSTTSEVGSDGDVYVGMALNLIYTSAAEISYNNCVIKNDSSMIFAPGGVPTEFRTSEKQIKTVTIPGLVNVANTQPTQYKKDSVMNIAKQWQQMVANNITNKQNAASTNTNITFNGGGSASGTSYTTNITKSNSTEVSLNIDLGLAISAGFEIAGSGVSGGGIVNFRIETGESIVLDTTTETTVGYELTDANSGDQFTVNVKKDKQSGTPVFELLAGQSSCPPEEGTQLRDQVQLSAPLPVVNDTNQTGTIEFKVYASNISPISTDLSRPFKVYLDATSSSDGAMIYINGVTNTSSSSTVPVTVPRLSDELILVRVVKMPASRVFSFTDLSIIIADPCTGDITDTIKLSAYFASPCSSIKITNLYDGWKLSQGNYQLSATATGYDRSSLTNVTMQYALLGSNDWRNVGPLLTPATLNSNSILGTTINWNTTGIADGNYNIRLKLECPQGTIYSEKVSGIIDHRAPALLGKPKPTDDNYVNGDVISFSYDENIAANSIDTANVKMTRFFNGMSSSVAVTVTGYNNSIVIVPVNSITSYVGSVMRVVVKNIPDMYGNIKTTPDTSYFLVDTTIIATGLDALRVNITQQKVSKNSDSTINISFKLPGNATATDSTRVNYTIGGTARLGIDYNIQYDGYQPAYTYANAAQGAIRLPKSSNQVTFRIRPIGDSVLAPDKTVKISLSEGGSYALGDTTTQTGTITSDDGITTYTFIGNGIFSDASNWLNNKKPLSTLVSGKTILINPSGICTLDVPLTIKPGATLRVMANRSFIISGNLKLN